MKKRIYIVAILAVAVLYQLFFSLSTTPLFRDCYVSVNGVNAADAMTVAKAALEGVLPYRDLYTLEGPATYLFTVIGYALAGRIGVWILQCIAMGVFLLLLWRFLRRYESARAGAVLIAGTLLLAAALLGSGGGLIEWALPLLMSLICYGTGKRDRKIYDAAGGAALATLFGINFWFGLLGMAIIFCSSKQTRKFLWAGFAVPVLGFVVYLIVTGSAEGFAEVIAGYHIPALAGGIDSLTEAIKRVVKGIPASILLFAAAAAWADRKTRNWLLISAAILFVYFVTGNGTWMKYGIIICYFPVCFSILRSRGRDRKFIAALLAACASCLVYVIPLRYYVSEYTDYCMNSVYQEEAEYFSEWKAENAVGQKEMFAIEISPKYYLLLDMIPVYRYYENQSEVGSYNEAAAYDIYDYIWDEGDKGMMLLSTGRGGIYEMLGNYLWVDLYNGSEPVAFYLWQDEAVSEE